MTGFAFAYAVMRVCGGQPRKNPGAPGTDYLCVLFSKYSVNIESLLNFLQKSSGNFYEKVKTGFSEYLASQNEINFSSTSMSFNATTTGAMVPLIVEFSHR